MPSWMYRKSEWLRRVRRGVGAARRVVQARRAASVPEVTPAPGCAPARREIFSTPASRRLRRQFLQRRCRSAPAPFVVTCEGRPRTDQKEIDMPTGTVRLHRIVRATPERVYRAFLDVAAMAKW